MKIKRNLHLTAKEKIKLISEGENMSVYINPSNNKRNYIVKLKNVICSGLKKGINL